MRNLINTHVYVFMYAYVCTKDLKTSIYLYVEYRF